jgi:pimeloyl-ACP methyl ester carboxylesterase
MLQTQGFTPPYVLVGHSLGGTFMKLFAKHHPDEIAGVVLVDARHSEFTQRCRELGVPRLMYHPPEALLNLLQPVPRAELEAAPLSLKQARRGGKFPDVPLIVLTQSNAKARWPAKLGKVWAASQRRMAKMSSLGRIKILDDAGHNVHVDRPDVVVRAVLNVVRAARYLAHRSGKRKSKPQG